VTYRFGRVLIRSLVALAAVWAFQTQIDVGLLAAQPERVLCMKSCKLFERSCPELCDELCTGEPVCVEACLFDCHEFADTCRTDCKALNVGTGTDSPDRVPTAEL